MHLFEEAEQLFVVREHPVLGLDALLFVGGEGRLVDLFDREAEKVDLPQPLALAGHELGEARPRRRPPLEQRRHFGGQIFRAAKPVEKLSVVLHVEERLVLVLPVVVEQQGRELLEVGAGDGG